jgi:hypothetical protein
MRILKEQVFEPNYIEASNHLRWRKFQRSIFYMIHGRLCIMKITWIIFVLRYRLFMRPHVNKDFFGIKY